MRRLINLLLLLTLLPISGCGSGLSWTPSSVTGTAAPSPSPTTQCVVIASNPLSDGTAQGTTATSDKVAQSFVAEASADIQTIRLHAATTVPGTSITVAIRYYGGANPESLGLLGSANASLTNLIENNFDVSFSPAIPVDSGSYYWIIATVNSTDDTYWYLQGGNPYGPGELKNIFNGNPWGGIAGDLYFVVNPCS